LAKEVILLDRQENEEPVEAQVQEAPKTVVKAKTAETQKVAAAADKIQKQVRDLEVPPVPEAEPQVPAQAFSETMQNVVAREAKEFFTTRFAIEAPGAKSVYVTGSFNDWSLDDGCRLEEVNGQWEVAIPLKPGSYKYQFIVDGVWKEDPNNPRRERNSFGDINSLVEVAAA